MKDQVSKTTIPGVESRNFIRFFGILYMLTLFVLAVIVFIYFGKTEITEGTYYTYTKTVSNWPAIIGSIIMIGAGCMNAAFAYVMAAISENLIFTRYYLSRKDRDFLPETEDEPSIN
jgi:hypothetical protein